MIKEIKKIEVWNAPQPAGHGAVNWGTWHYVLLTREDEFSFRCLHNLTDKLLRSLGNGWHYVRPSALIEVRLDGKMVDIYRISKEVHLVQGK